MTEPNKEAMETWRVGGKDWCVIGSYRELFFVIERDDPLAAPILRDRQWLESGERVKEADDGK